MFSPLDQFETISLFSFSAPVLGNFNLSLTNLVGQLRPYSNSSNNLTDFSGNPELDEIIFENLLGDGYLILGKGYLNARFGFQQSTIHTEYFMAVFTIFKNLNLCSTNYGPYFYLD